MKNNFKSFQSFGNNGLAFRCFPSKRKCTQQAILWSASYTINIRIDSWKVRNWWAMTRIIQCLGLNYLLFMYGLITDITRYFLPHKYMSLLQCAVSILNNSFLIVLITVIIIMVCMVFSIRLFFTVVCRQLSKWLRVTIHQLAVINLRFHVSVKL